MNQKSNALISIDLKIHYKRKIALREIVAWLLPVLVLLGRHLAQLKAGQ
jgi:hypothetical protein